MTTQKIEEIIFEEFEKNKDLVKTKNSKISVQNSNPLLQDSWTAKITAAINISDLAAENGIDQCPKCDYSLYFDDSRGFFICSKAKFEGDCDFKGGIVDFAKFCEGGIW